MTNPSPNNIDSSWIDDLMVRIDQGMLGIVKNPNKQREIKIFKDAKAEIQKKLTEVQAEKLEWAWAIIANAGKIWDEDTKEAKEWREVAWQLEKEYYDNVEQLAQLQNRNDDERT